MQLCLDIKKMKFNISLIYIHIYIYKSPHFYFCRVIIGRQNIDDREISALTDTRETIQKRINNIHVLNRYHQVLIEVNKKRIMEEVQFDNMLNKRIKYLSN